MTDLEAVIEQAFTDAGAIYDTTAPKAAILAAAQDLAAVPGCPTPCDNDCERPCHEVHQIPRRQDHHPEDCVATLVAKVVADERERIAQLAEQLGVHYLHIEPVAKVSGYMPGCSVKPFADLLREGGGT